ncbi:uncharacterized protein LAESUDRAFT_574256 [Laetiporus sulphureus 93-53]|uniref:F-box domain-containing protein n=1 Tax=Laetiporus sulphureus 93-53 TaxID=1314785 RepID=A0A165B270_9APHY|nr:uncharacterized protein LAESUDRAFT_574256 [Laetiporus sulphureus 93-53]KZT00088.1 hypothetical protein LAESUDRAFT_574256 [Laetiporus sulphureus 93-53]
MISSDAMPAARPLASIQSLPAEVTEQILILTAAAGFPTAIASLAQTCHVLHTIVYHSTDQHLWREVFLTTFDDPRQGSSDEDQQRDNLEWGKEFRRRVWTMNYFRRTTASAASGSYSSSLILSQSELTLAEQVDSDIFVLESIISVVRTALPFPPTICYSIPRSYPSYIPHGPGIEPTFPGYSIFPPQTHPSARSLSKNISWLEALFRHGYPPSLAQKLSGIEWEGGVMINDLSTLQARLIQALGRVVSYTGFLPVPPVGSEEVTNDSIADGVDSLDEADEDAAKDMVDSTCDRIEQEDFITASDDEEPVDDTAGSSLPDMSIVAQNRRARRLARMRAYNLRYLSPNRYWGPFLPVEDNQSAETTCEDECAEEEDMTQCLDYDYSSSSDEDDEECALSGSPEQTVQPPDEALLLPDWAYLAAARVIVEANLREAVGPEQFNGLTALESLRAGSAPMDVSASVFSSRCVEKQVSGMAGASVPSTIGCASMSDGWDWAGVTGVWRRCICWLDYCDLRTHNLSGGFNDPQLTEAVRIVPMRLRVVSYSPSPIAAYPNRPIIQIAGETSGLTTTGQPRKLKGAVRTLADGSVRWTVIFTGRKDGDPDEWTSEGVQIGGVTSAMGVLGIWTGAQHEKSDPLGPFWAWKVG